MNKLWRFIMGLGVGISAGFGIVALLSPVSGKEFRQNLRDHLKESRQKAQEASIAKQIELEAELLAMREKKEPATTS